LRTGMYGAWIIASMFFSFPPAKGWYLTGNEKEEGSHGKGGARAGSMKRRKGTNLYSMSRGGRERMETRYER
jgi:hypothetical protein